MVHKPGLVSSLEAQAAKWARRQPTIALVAAASVNSSTTATLVCFLMSSFQDSLGKLVAECQSILILLQQQMLEMVMVKPNNWNYLMFYNNNNKLNNK